MKEIISSSNSKSEVIRKGSEQILNRMRISDINGAKQIKDYLISNVEDSVYVVFDSFNYALILYWIQDYDGLIDYFLHFDSLEVVNREKIKPENYELYLELAWSLPEAFKFLIQPINNSSLTKEYKEVLILYLYKKASEVDEVDYKMKGYNNRVNQFRFKYPNSRLIKFVKDQIQQ
ncbi:MAG: hypothetical protein MUO72_08505 [Bacteroidales bacterium]|nr:hypothetical protein [Bacteroidales bacterium]